MGVLLCCCVVVWLLCCCVVVLLCCGSCGSRPLGCCRPPCGCSGSCPSGAGCPLGGCWSCCGLGLVSHHPEPFLPRCSLLPHRLLFPGWSRCRGGCWGRGGLGGPWPLWDLWQPVLRGVEVGEEVAERVEESGEAAAWQGALGLGETLLEEVVARHCWETLGGLRMEGLLWVGCLGVEGLL